MCEESSLKIMRDIYNENKLRLLIDNSIYGNIICVSIVITTIIKMKVFIHFT